MVNGLYKEIKWENFTGGSRSSSKKLGEKCEKDSVCSVQCRLMFQSFSSVKLSKQEKVDKKMYKRWFKVAGIVGVDHSRPSVVKNS